MKLFWHQEIKYLPVIDSDDWIDWFISTRKVLSLSREEIVTMAKIDKGDLSNFESKTRKLGTKRRRKLLECLLQKAFA